MIAISQVATATVSMVRGAATWVAQSPLVMAQPGDPDPSDGHGPEWGKAAPAGLLIWLFMGVALFFLIKSMNRHMKRVPKAFGADAGAPRGGTGTAATPGGGAPAGGDAATADDGAPGAASDGAPGAASDGAPGAADDGAPAVAEAVGDPAVRASGVVSTADRPE